MNAFAKRIFCIGLMLALLLSAAVGCVRTAETGRQAADDAASYTIDYEAEQPVQEPDRDGEPLLDAIETEPLTEPLTVFSPPTGTALFGEPETSVPTDGGRTAFDGNSTFTIDYEDETAATANAGGLTAFELLEELTTDADAAEVAPFRPVSGDELYEIAEQVEAEEKEAEANGTQTSVIDTVANAANEQTGVAYGTQSTLLGAASMPRQMTIEDIQALNPNTTVIDIYTNQGYLSTLIGKYYEGKVTNFEEGVLSIQGMASLLGLSKGSNFFAVYSERNNQGYTFYTYQQRYGGVTLQYATLRIVVDPDGYTAGLSCSFIPNIGTASQEPAIGARDAEALVEKIFSGLNLTYYSEHTMRLAIPFNNRVYNCWVVYTNNPDATVSFDMPYIEHCVTTDGKYLTMIPASDFAIDSADALDNSTYFEGMEVQTLTKTLRLEDGSERTVSVPVSYNPRDSKFYLMDPSRKIAVAQYYDFNYNFYDVNFVTSDTVDGWSQNNLLAYANYIVMYDFYADHGIRSVDGFGTPILVTVGWCEKDGTPVNNACYYGLLNGWACFGVSDVNHASDCVDVVGHEFTHGITYNSMQGCIYQNETGAMNEAYSDIMGNLAEMSMDYTADRTWLIAERSGKISRSMSDPNAHQQPAFVGDLYYTPSVSIPNFDVNDLGGVHGNNSLVGHIAYKMDQAGMTYEQQISMWLNSIELLTPRSDYQDLHGALLFALKINGMLQQFGPALNRAFAEAGLNDDWTESYRSAAREGCGRATLLVGEDFLADPCVVMFVNVETRKMFCSYPEESGTVSVLLPAGVYIAQLGKLTNNKPQYFNYTESGWKSTGGFLQIPVEDGGVTDLTKRSGVGKTAGKSLTLIPVDGGYFSMLMPDGWRIEINGQYGSWSVKLFDPYDVSTQLFFYSSLAPFHKSQATQRFWAKYDKTGIIANGPILPQENVVGMLGTWAYCIEYQKYYERQYFTDLKNFDVLGAYRYKGYFYADYGSIDTAAFVRCDTNFDTDCRLTIMTSLVDTDTVGAFGGNMFYMANGTLGILAPKDRYDEVFEDLLTCFTSIRFTRRYIEESQGSEFPMLDLDTIIQNELDYADIMRAVYGRHH